MAGLSINISQTQALMLLAQAQASLNLVVQGLQQAIAGAQSAGATTVTLSTALLQGIDAQLQATVNAVEAGRIRQQQMIMVRIRGDIDVMIRARQMQIANILARVRANLNASVRTVQRLLATAATSGAVTITLAAAQQLLADIQASLTALVQAAALQTQNIQIISAAG
ncbi:MAG TPA: hypothetical protein VK464_03705 [Symbiobacteriaceae bacterium]|nr:hypothetical protein [Symbiobacteriaceae bacterium]